MPNRNRRQLGLQDNRFMTTKYNTYANDQLDREVAERVLGWEFQESHQHSYRYYGMKWRKSHISFAKEAPRSSTSHDAFFTHVVPAMRERGVYFAWNDMNNRAKFMLHGDKLIGEYGALNAFTKLPRAGCIAALMAMDAMEQNKEVES